MRRVTGKIRSIGRVLRIRFCDWLCGGEKGEVEVFGLG